MQKFEGTAFNIEDNRNKTTEITDASTDIQYPSAKAVKDYVDRNAINYSTSEHEIGTWIDGSKLYEKTFVANIADSSGLEHTIEIENSEIDTCVAMDCVLIDVGKQAMGQGIYADEGEIIASVLVYYHHRTTPTKDEIFTEITNDDFFGYPLTVYVTIRYTKELTEI